MKAGAVSSLAEAEHPHLLPAAPPDQTFTASDRGVASGRWFRLPRKAVAGLGLTLQAYGIVDSPLLALLATQSLCEKGK
jgi:hypothetical protein